MMERLGRLVGWRTFLSWVLLWIALGSAAWGFSKMIPALDLNALVVILATGVLAGWGLACWRLSGWWAGVIACTGGVLGLVFQYGQLGSALAGLLRSSIELLGGALRWRSLGPPDLTPLLLNLSELGGRVSGVISRLGDWASNVLARQPALDPLAVGLAWGFVIWAAATWAAWATFRRRQALVGMLPSGLLLAGMLNYTGINALTLAPLIGSTLMLMALAHYNRQEAGWKARKVDVAEDVGVETGAAAFGLALGLVILAVVAPSISVQSLVQLGNQIYQAHASQSEPVAEALGLQQPQPPSSSLGGLRSPGLPRQHLIHSGPELSRRVVMVITTGELPPAPSLEMLGLEAPNYYWRIATYDIYTGQGWETSGTEREFYQAREPALENAPPPGPNLRLVQQNVQIMQEDTDWLAYTGMLYTADANYQVIWRQPADQAADAFGAMTREKIYLAQSLLPWASEVGLRAAGNEVPQWLIERYLALPESIPPRVAALADKLTADQLTAYDKALAIETYLRSFTYTLEIESPPGDRDVVDYFLFDLQMGYCDYYATSMVVLARLAGLPARAVMGYASGSYDPPSAHYVVTEADAHTWAEIYFPGIGWVEFEPTAGQPAIQRPTGQTQAPALPEIKPKRDFDPRAWLRAQPWQVIWLALISLAMVTLLVWIGNDLWRLGSMQPDQAIILAYRRMRRLGNPLAAPTVPGDTPYEFIERLQTRLARLPRGGRRSKVWEPAIPAIQQIARLYALSVYSPHPASLADQRKVVRAWKDLRWRLWLARAWNTVQQKRQRGI